MIVNSDAQDRINLIHLISQPIYLPVCEKAVKKNFTDKIWTRIILYDSVLLFSIFSF
jgi:hypothetical protein